MDIKDYIFIKEECFDEETLKRLLKWIKNDLFFEEAPVTGPHGKGIISKGIRQVGQRFITNLNIPDSQNSYTSVMWYNLLVHLFMSLTIDYFNKHNFVDRVLDSDMEIVILKYEKTDFYKPHSDHHKFTPRNISFTFILNDGFTGGEFNFYFNNTSEMKIQNKKNMCILFPSNFIFAHSIQPITQGTRYAIVGWMP